MNSYPNIYKKNYEAGNTQEAVEDYRKLKELINDMTPLPETSS